MPWSEVVQFRGSNTGPEIVTPILPEACWLPWGESQECSLARGKRKQELWPHQVSRALQEQHGMWV